MRSVCYGELPKEGNRTDGHVMTVRGVAQVDYAIICREYGALWTGGIMNHR